MVLVLVQMMMMMMTVAVVVAVKTAVLVLVVHFQRGKKTFGVAIKSYKAAVEKKNELLVCYARNCLKNGAAWLMRCSLSWDCLEQLV